ncbi:LLM class flavin-dependent oxidoreductase [Actinoplanes siamensis]|uniref:Luciferase n=1 Tax=Actinoplanes siamensis TaxID=1223317 RepID=A0A919NDQ4_9ACTN|nr:LLM class flavin-dependent oxidoreductase [Actinoplanes siamensis]GIF09349.1 luciferase [Actinoplanes siamensis]
MRVGVIILPDRGWQESKNNWRTADQLGFDSAWTYDHLSWGPLIDRPWLSAFPTLAAAASVTERIELGTLVTSPNFRHPVLLARDALTIDDLSGGRFVLGVGAGSVSAGDAQVLSSEPLARTARTRRFAEFVQLLDRLLTEPLVDHDGAFYTVNQARNVPVNTPGPSIPLAIAATAPRGQELAARFGDIWVTLGPPELSTAYQPAALAAVVGAQMAGLEAACDRVGRDPGELRRVFVMTDLSAHALASTESFVEFTEEYANLGITDLAFHWPRESGIFAGDPEIPFRVAEALPALRDK